MNAPAAHVPRIEVIIPIHDPERPLARTLASIRAGGLPPRAYAITVVCHNVPVEAIAATLPEAEREGVTFLHCADGSTSPAGPRRLAVAAGAAEFVCFVDSDDWLEPKALAEWLSVAERGSRGGAPVAAVIAPERHANGKPVRNPPLRPIRLRRELHPRKDRLAYRSALRGLFGRHVARELGIDFGTQRGNGSDLAFSLGFWYSGRNVVFASTRPAYVLSDDGVARVTRAPRPLADEVAACREILTGAWFAALPARDRALIATKFVRVHLLPALIDRVASGDPDAGALEDARSFLALADSTAPTWERSLSVRDARLVAALRAPAATSATLGAFVPWWRQRSPLLVAVAARPLAQLRIDAPWRWVVAMLLLPFRMRRPASRTVSPRSS